MVDYVNRTGGRTRTLSVLALSSRFDGPINKAVLPRQDIELSVLALSSRFDGLSRRARARYSS